MDDYHIIDKELYNKIKKFVIYQNKFMVVFRSTRGDFIVWNLKKSFSTNGKRGHSHLKSLTQAKIIADNISKSKFPKTRDMYLLSAYIRCSDDAAYTAKIQELINTRRSKGEKMSYKNWNV